PAGSTARTAGPARAVRARGRRRAPPAGPGGAAASGAPRATASPCALRAAVPHGAIVGAGACEPVMAPRWRSRAGGPAHREGAEEPQQQEPGRDRDGEAGTVGEDLDQLVEGAGRGVLRPQLRQYRARRVGQRLTVPGGLAGERVTAGGEAGGEHRTRYRGAERGAQLAHGGLRGRALPRLLRRHRSEHGRGELGRGAGRGGVRGAGARRRPRLSTTVTTTSSGIEVCGPRSAASTPRARPARPSPTSTAPGAPTAAARCRAAAPEPNAPPAIGASTRPACSVLRACTFTRYSGSTNSSPNSPIATVPAVRL